MNKKPFQHLVAGATNYTWGGGGGGDGNSDLNLTHCINVNSKQISLNVNCKTINLVEEKNHQDLELEKHQKHDPEKEIFDKISSNKNLLLCERHC